MDNKKSLFYGWWIAAATFVIPIFNSIKVNQQVNYKVTRLQKCFGTTNQPF